MTTHEQAPECFVAMPISDPDGYDPGHFSRVYEQVFRPACERAGFRPVRADDVRETNLIHLDVLRRLVDSPIVLCDLSGRNPNVLFELGMRQAFDKPAVLVQESGASPIFDVALLRVTSYRRSRLYDEVLEDQVRIADAITATMVAAQRTDGVNSIVRMLGLVRPATLREEERSVSEPMLQLIRAELDELRRHVTDSVALANAEGANAVWEQMIDDAIDEYQNALEAAAKLDRTEVDVAAVEAFRNEVYEAMNRAHQRIGHEPGFEQAKFMDAEAKWRKLLEYVLRKPTEKT